MKNIEKKFMIKVRINEEDIISLIVETDDGNEPNKTMLKKRLDSYVKKHMLVLCHYEIKSIKPLLKALNDDFDSLTLIKN